MNKKICLKKYTGFSLAETLVTLLIVAIVAIASVPVITKKKATPVEPSGTWMCTLNSQGEHVVWKTGDKNMNDADLWTPTNEDFCEFSVPKGARNFAITAVGGGGGGAGAGLESKVWTTSFNIPYAGRYKMAAIGAGGNGARGEDWGGSLVPGGGGAGGVGYAEYEFTDNVKSLSLTRGLVDPNTTDERSGTRGGASKISATYQDNLFKNQTIELINAGGGNGGRGCQSVPFVCNAWKDFYSKQGSVSISNINNDYIKTIETKNFNSDTGDGDAQCNSLYCFGYRTVAHQLEVNKKMEPFVFFNVYNDIGGLVKDRFSEQYGRGGTALHQAERRGDNKNNPYYKQPGRNGYVMVVTSLHKPGLGGEAGEHVERAFYSEFDSKKLKVIIGKGGTGGSAGSSEPTGNVYNPYISTKKPTEATDGTSTQIVGLLTLYGGKHGKSLQESDIKAMQEAKGGDGEPSPLRKSKKLVEVGSDMDLLKKYQTGLGGLSQGNTSVDGQTSLFYGAGGGGGGVDADSKAGKGADGSPGFVMIEW